MNPLFRRSSFSAILAAFSLAFASNARAQAPSATDVSPTYNTDVSSIIGSSGYDAWSGSVHREVVDMVVSGAISEHGLKWSRVYNSTSGGWSFSYGWKYSGRGQPDAEKVYYPDGRVAKADTRGYSEAGTKDRIMQPNHSQGSGITYLYLEDGSRIEMDRETDTLENPNGNSVTLIDYNYPEWLVDRHGRRTLLEWEVWYGYYPYTTSIRLKRITDPSGRSITLQYDPQNRKLIEVDGSDGQWVRYSSTSATFDNAGNILTYGTMDVSYSDGTSAHYKDGPEYHENKDNTTQNPNGGAMQLVQDIRAVSAMQSEYYEYGTPSNPGHFPGQVMAERHLNSDMTAGAVVSRFTCNSYKDTTVLDATQTETRQDGAFSRKIYMKRGEANVPLVQWKEDFHDASHAGIQEQFSYGASGTSSSNYLTAFTDRRGNTTQYDLTGSIIGEPNKITHPKMASEKTASFIQYGYDPNTDPVPAWFGDTHNPYFINTVTDENNKTTTYQRDDTVQNGSYVSYWSGQTIPYSYATHLVKEIDYPDGGVEKFTYNNVGQVTIHQRKNGFYEYADYDATGLLTTLWNPTNKARSALSADDPHTTFEYYQTGDSAHPWTDRIKTVTDPRGYRTTYEYDHLFDANGVQTNTPCPGRGLVTKISYPDDIQSGNQNGTSKSFVYDIYGNKLSETDELGHTTAYTYDDYNRPKSVTLSGLPAATNDYTPPGYSPYSHTSKSVYIHSSAAGVVATQTFDPNYRLLSKTEGASDSTIAATTNYGYDPNGNLTSSADPRGSAYTTSIIYDERNRKINSTDPLSQITSWGYDPASNILSITRPDKTVESKTYDAMNRVQTDTVPKDAANGSTAATSITTSFVYNTSGTLQSVTVPQTDTVSLTTNFQYDSFDEKIKMIYPNGTDSEAWSYDANKNLIARTTVHGESQLFNYDSRNREISMAWSNAADWARFGYDAAGRMVTAQNPSSLVTRSYDDANRLILDRQQVQIMPIRAVSRKTHGSAGDFDVSLPLTGTPGVECRVGQGPNSDQHKIVVTFPRPVAFHSANIASGPGTVVSATTGPATDGTQVTINLSGVTDGQTVVVTLAGVSDGTTTNDVNVGMAALLGDTNGDGLVNSADEGQVKSFSGGVTTTASFRTDLNVDGSINSADIGLVKSRSGTGVSFTQLTQPIPATPSIDVQYEHDSDGRQTRLYATSAGAGTGGYDYTFRYDSMGRFWKLSNTGGSQLFQYSYDLASNEIHRLNNVTSVDQDYGVPDKLDRMVQRDIKAGNSVVSHEVYSHDPMNRLTLVDRTENNVRTGDMFGYNLAGELTSAQYELQNGQTTTSGATTGLPLDSSTVTNAASNTWANPARAVNYVLDKSGNRTSVGDGSSSTFYTTNNLNQYSQVGANAVTNGSEHELANYQNVAYKYINDTHLSSISGTDVSGHQSNYSLSYDAFGRCVARVLNGATTSYIYDGEKAILEYKSWSNGPSAVNLYGKSIDEILVRADNTTSPAQTLYYQDDHEGSVTHLMMMVNNTPTVVESYKYDAFGSPTITPAPANGQIGSAYGNRFMFTGREYVATFGVYEYRNRAYHPGLGRFMSEDPKGFASGSYNLFEYCNNDPEDLTDPMGLAPYIEFEQDRLAHAMNSQASSGLTFGSLNAANEPQQGGAQTQKKQDNERGPGGRKIYPTEQAAVNSAGMDAVVKTRGAKIGESGEFNNQVYKSDKGERYIKSSKDPQQAVTQPVNVLQKDGTKVRKMMNGSDFTHEAPIAGYHRVAGVVSVREPLPDGPSYHDRTMFELAKIHGYIFAPPARVHDPDPTVFPINIR